MTDTKFNADAVGVWSEPEKFEVTRDRIGAYAAATNDPIAAHLNGDVASPVFAVVPPFMSIMGAAFALAPPELAIRVVHGMQDFRYHRPIRPGDVVTSRIKPIGYAGAPNGTTATFFIECTDADGQLLNEQYMTAFFRKVDVGETVGELAPSHKLSNDVRNSAPIAKFTQHVDDDQTFRYSPASGDPMPIHLDEETAKLSGLPGIIAHGLCMQAFMSWGVLSELAVADSMRLKRLAVRFAKPVLPGQDVTNTLWKVDSSDGVTAYAFEASVGDDVVIKDGLAEIAD